MIRQPIPSITWTFRVRGIQPDEIHKVGQGWLNVWVCVQSLVGELVIGDQDDTGKLKPGAILMTNEYAYRNTSDPQEIADDIYACNQGDVTVAQLNPNTAASVLGKLGGSATSEAKTLANRAKANNPPKEGKKPRGRPSTKKAA